MGYVNKIQIGENAAHLIEPTLYGTCSTAATTAIKDVTLDSFTLIPGIQIAVKFTVTNTAAASDLKLRVNSTNADDAKPIKYRGANLSDKGTLANKRVYLFLYDGTNWELVGDIDTNSNTVQRTFRSSYNVELPIAGINASNSATATYDTSSSISSGSYASMYAAIPNTVANLATINPSTGKITVPGGVVADVTGNASTATNVALSGVTDAENLQAIEALTGTEGFLKKTAENTWILDTNNYVTSSGITSVTIGATSPVQSSTSSTQTGSSASTTISLKDAYGDTKNPYGAKGKNLVLAGPSSGNDAAPSFRALVAADIPDISGTYLKLTGGQMTGPLTWKNATALPQTTSADYFLAIDAFATGGKTYYISKANLLSSIGAASADDYLKLDGSNVMSGQIKLGSSTQSSAPNDSGIYIHDTRSVSHLPTTWGNKTVQWYFDSGAADTGRTGHATIMHLKGWADSGSTTYAAHQLSFNATSNTNDGNLYHRTGLATTWQAWRKILDSENYTDYTVTKTGSGASGSWDISVTGSSASCTGNAATATYATKLQTYKKNSTTETYDTSYPIYAQWFSSTEIKLKCDNYTTYVDNVTGTIAVTHGGTGKTTISANAMLYASAKDTFAEISANTTTTRKFLRMTGTGSAGAAPEWDTLTSTDVGLGNVENTKLSTWTGSSNIATVGTITTGTWNGTKLEIQYGGTGGITADAARANLGIGNGRVFYGTCETTASTTTKQVECANFNKDTDFVPGTIVSVLFSVKNTGAVGSLQLTVGNSINGYSEAKPIKKIYYTSGVSNLTNAAELPANGIVTFVYTGVYWQVVGLDYNVNTNTLLRTYTGNADYEYPLLAQNSAANATAQWTEYTTSYKDYYGVIPDSSTTRATINLSTGRITVPGGITTSGVTLFTNATAATSTTTGAVRISGGLGVAGSVYGTSVYGAVWNDYAEYRQAQDQVKPGNVVIDTDWGTLRLSTKRLQPGAQVVSDTFGFAIGKTDICQTPLAVSGRVLAYTYQPRENYHAGMAVCSAPNGTIDIMTREEIQKYPDAIIGIVSEIPNYESWGTGNVPINGRIWIKVR